MTYKRYSSDHGSITVRFYEEENEWYIERIFVEEDFRFCGEGTQLLQRCLSEVDEANGLCHLRAIAEWGVRERDKKGLKQDALVSWYGKYGFVPQRVWQDGATEMTRERRNAIS